MNKHTRREFLTKTILGAVGGGVALSLFSPEDLAGQATKRGYTAGKFALDIGGVPAGWIESAEGGHATSDVVTEKVGVNVPRKNMGTVVYEPITINCGVGMSRSFYEWIKESIGMSRPQDGAVHICDYDGNVKSTLEFHKALITEIGFPALDAGSKDTAKMTIKLAPEFTRMLTGPGKKIALSSDAAKQKRWLPSNFKLEIPGVDCTRVSRIDAITIKQTVGAQRGGIRGGPANLEPPNLVATVEESHADGFSKWMMSSSRNPSLPDNKKPGQLEFLSADLREALFTLRFPDLTIRRLTPEPGKMGLKSVKAEMYFQGLQFQYSAV
jgi:phage tail-like protein